MSRPAATRKDFLYFHEMSTRWRDNDVYAHMNNAVFYEYIDTAVNYWIIREAGLPVPQGNLVALVVQSSCDFIAPLGFPDPVVAGVGVTRIGRTSVTYRVALFRGQSETAAAIASFTHVYVGRADRTPQALPVDFRRKLEEISVPA